MVALILMFADNTIDQFGRFFITSRITQAYSKDSLNMLKGVIKDIFKKESIRDFKEDSFRRIKESTKGV